MHSQLNREDTQFAIRAPEEAGVRKIIVSTNIVENAITIDDLMGTVDSCLRKEIHVDEDGIKELKFTLATQSNIIQAYGRSGRQGAAGNAYIAVSKHVFDGLPKYALSDIERNPIYSQLVKIFKHDLPYEKLLVHIPKRKVVRDIAYLERYEMIRPNGPGKYSLTEIGDMISHMPCSIKVGNFIAKSVFYCEYIFDLKKRHSARTFSNIMYDVEGYYFYVAIIAAWIDYGRSLFEYPSKRYNEDRQTFIERSDMMKGIQEQFFMEDSLDTFINLWFESYTTRNLYNWCRDNYIFYKGVNEIDRSTRDIIRSLEPLLLSRGYYGRRLRIPRLSKPFDYTQYPIEFKKIPMSLSGRPVNVLKPLLMSAFNNFIYRFYRTPSNRRNFAEYLPYDGEPSGKYVLDRGVASVHTRDPTKTGHIISLNVRRKGNMYFLGLMVSIPIPTDPDEEFVMTQGFLQPQKPAIPDRNPVPASASGLPPAPGPSAKPMKDILRDVEPVPSLGPSVISGISKPPVPKPNELDDMPPAPLYAGPSVEKPNKKPDPDISVVSDAWD